MILAYQFTFCISSLEGVCLLTSFELVETFLRPFKGRAACGLWKVYYWSNPNQLKLDE